MAFNLKKVVRALLLSSSQPLAIKDIQAAVTRFHEQKSAMAALLDEAAAASPAGAAGADAAPVPAEGAAPGEPAPAAGVPADEPAEIFVEAPQDPELYDDVPAMVTAAQLRDVLDEIALELRAGHGQIDPPSVELQLDRRNGVFRQRFFAGSGRSHQHRTVLRRIGMDPGLRHDPIGQGAVVIVTSQG
jgi:hypothetical protein